MTPIHSVIVFLYDENRSYLFQLRDNKPHIIFPAHWGLFGGEIEEDEEPRDAVFRELQEEIEYVPEEIYGFHRYYRQDFLRGELRDYYIHAHYGKLTVTQSELVLQEGADLALFTENDILTGQMFSEKFQKRFPIVPPLMNYLKDFLITFPSHKKQSIEESRQFLGRENISQDC